MKTSCTFSASQKHGNVRSSILLLPQGFPFFSTSSSFTRGIHASRAKSAVLTLPQIPNPHGRQGGYAINEELSLDSKIAWKLKAEVKMDMWVSSISAVTLSRVPPLHQHTDCNSHTFLTSENGKTQWLRQGGPQGSTAHVAPYTCTSPPGFQLLDAVDITNTTIPSFHPQHPSGEKWTLPGAQDWNELQLPVLSSNTKK